MDIATPVCHGLLHDQTEHGDDMSNLPENVRAQLRALDLVGFIVAPAQAGAEIALADTAKSGMSKLGIPKVGIARTR
jgi:hypothetical protein